jgi:hypothetical protein
MRGRKTTFRTSISWSLEGGLSKLGEIPSGGTPAGLLAKAASISGDMFAVKIIV